MGLKRSLFNRDRTILILSIGLFICSLTQPSYCTTTGCGDSIAVFISGAIGFLLGGAALTWLANPLLFISWFLINRKPKLSLITSLTATLIALSFLLFKQVINDEAGNYSNIISYKPGYWLWLSSSIAMFGGNLHSFTTTKMENKKLPVRSNNNKHNLS
jgi:hypothetical protein